MTMTFPRRALRPIGAFHPRNAVRPLRSATAAIFSRAHTGGADGVCGSCERHASWHEHLGYYVCASCGRDPVEHAEAS